MPLWLWRGKALLKQEICRRVELYVTRLPYHVGLLDRLQEEHRAGRPIVLVTGLAERQTYFGNDELLNTFRAPAVAVVARRERMRSLFTAGSADDLARILREAPPLYLCWTRKPPVRRGLFTNSRPGAN